MVLPLGLCLLWALAASQEICSSPGDLPAPTLILSKGSTPQGDTIILLCFVPMDTSVTRVIFCKDGKEILMLPKDRNKLIFESAQPVSPESPGEYFCRYQHKDDRNQEKTSLPSARRHVSAPGRPSPSVNNTSRGEPSPPVPSCCDSFPGLGLIVGLAVTAGLALGLLGCFLMKTVVSRCRTHRDPSPDRSSLAAEDQIQYAEVTRVGTAQPRVDRNVAVTYAVVGQGGSRVQDTRPAP
ncbi:unnamed protein product [Lepidochelys kempii]